MSHRIEVQGHPGLYVRRLTFREFSNLRKQATDAEAAGESQEVAFTCCLLVACAETEDGAKVWPDFELVASDERPMLVADVAAAATIVNGLADEDDAGNA